MTSTPQLQDLIGHSAVDRDGARIGRIGQICLDEVDGEPYWLTVATSRFGGKESFAPLFGSRIEGDAVVLAVEKDLVKTAPRADADGRLAAGEPADLYEHYRGRLGERPPAQ